MVKFNSFLPSLSLTFLLSCSSVVMAMEQKTTGDVHASPPDRAQCLARIREVIVKNALPEVTGVFQPSQSALALVTFKNGMRIAYEPGLRKMIVMEKRTNSQWEVPLQSSPVTLTHPGLLEAFFPEITNATALFNQNLVEFKDGTAVMLQPDGLAQVIDKQGNPAWQFSVEASSISGLSPKAQK